MAKASARRGATRASRNSFTVAQLDMACRHAVEMMAAGFTENFAVRILEDVADVYATLATGGSASPHAAARVALWSLEALRVRDANPGAKPRDHFVVEHGTPRRQFARLVLDLHRRGTLDEVNMRQLVESRWKLAVITTEENARLNARFRSTLFDTPEARWSAAGIEFPPSDA